MILRLTDGTTTINLTGGDIKLQRAYTPTAQKGDGDVDVSESVDVTITGATVAAIEATIRAIGALFCQAREYQRRKVATQVWVEFRWDDSGDVYRSEVVDGSVAPDRDTGGKAYREAMAISALVAWQRRGWWEGPEATLPLANDYDYRDGSIGIGIANCNDVAETAVDDEVIETADGSATYSGTFAQQPVKRGSVAITYTIDGSPHVATDDEYGNLSGDHVTSGTIDYLTGDWSLTFESASHSVGLEVLVAICDGIKSTFNSGVDGSPISQVPITSLSEKLYVVSGASTWTRHGDTYNPAVPRDYIDGWDEESGSTIWLYAAIDLDTGDWTLSFFSDDAHSVPLPPDNGSPIKVDYQAVYTGPDSGTDITADYSYKSSGYLNFVDLLANDVEGELPTPVKLTVENLDATAYFHYVGHNIFSNPATLDPILEASGSADAGCSGGAYHAIALTGTEAKLDAWYVYPLDDWAGAWFQVLARFKTAPPAGTLVRLRAGYGTTGTPVIAWDGAWRELTTALIQDIGAVRLPLHKIGDLTNPMIVLCVYGYNTGGSGTLDLDFLQTTPTDSYRMYKPISSASIANNGKLIDDGIQEIVYNNNIGIIQHDIVPYGEPIRLWPGRTNRFYFLVTESAAAPIDHLSQVYMSYRPRRSTL